MSQLVVLFVDINMQVSTVEGGRKYVKELNVMLMSQYARFIRIMVDQAKIRDTRKFVSLAD